MGWRENLRLKLLRAEALRQQGHRCLYCKGPLPLEEATAEHRRARSRGGLDTRANIAAACLPCNRARGNMRQDHFYKLIDRAAPPRGEPVTVLLIWATRRIWKRADRACARIHGIAR